MLGRQTTRIGVREYDFPFLGFATLRLKLPKAPDKQWFSTTFWIQRSEAGYEEIEKSGAYAD